MKAAILAESKKPLVVANVDLPKKLMIRANYWQPFEIQATNLN